MLDAWGLFAEMKARAEWRTWLRQPITSQNKTSRQIMLLCLKLRSKIFLLCKKSMLVIFQDLEKRWQQYVTDHESYEQKYHDCDAWITDLQHRLESCASSDGDKFAIQSKLDKLQVCFSS